MTASRLCTLGACIVALAALPCSWAQDPLSFGPFARQNPLRFITEISHLPQQQQRIYLKLIGEGLQRRHDLPCNPFGGEEACMALSSTSKFAQVCSGSPLKVDCAYYSEDELEVDDDPSEDLKKALASRGFDNLESACPECFENQRKFWCAQTVPKCGSFQASVEQAILPALATVTEAQENGQTQLEALSDALPLLLNATAHTLPCREMCEAVVQTCSCKRELTFGHLMDAWLADGSALAQSMPRSFLSTAFARVARAPLCSLYLPAATPGFAGHCDTALPKTCSDADRWCNGDGGQNMGPEVAQELMAGQLAATLFGWTGLTGAGLADDEQAMMDDADKDDVKAWERSYVKRSGGGNVTRSHSRASNVVLIVLLVVLSVLFGGAAVFLWHRYSSIMRRQGAGAGDHGGYVSLGVVDSDALYEPPLSAHRAEEQQEDGQQPQQEHAHKPVAELGTDSRPVH